MAYIVRVFFEDRIWNLDLETFEEITIGNSSQDTVRIEEAGDIRILIRRTENGLYQISGSFLVRVEGEMYAPVASDILEEWGMYRVNCSYDMGITVHPKQKNDDRVLLLSDYKGLQFGRNRVRNDVVLSNKRTSSVHCSIVNRGGEFFLYDLNSTNGTYLNGKLVTDENGEKLYDGDVICMSIYRMQVIAGKLYFYNTGKDLDLNVQAADPSEETIFDDGGRIPGNRRNLYALAAGKEPGLLRGQRLQKRESSDKNEPSPDDRGDREVKRQKAVDETASSPEEVFRPEEAPARPGQGGFPQWASRAGQDESTAYGEYTMVGTEEDLQPPSSPQAVSRGGMSESFSVREEPPRMAEDSGQEDLTAYGEYTQVGSDEDLDQLRKEVLQRGAYQHRLMQSSESERGIDGSIQRNHGKMCSDDSAVIHLTEDGE